MTSNSPVPALPYQRILLATGGAPHSQVAETRAMQLATAQRLPLEVVVSVPLASGMGTLSTGVPGMETLELEAQQALTESRREVLERVMAQARTLGLEVRGHLVEGKGAAEAILQVAEETGADLIVMGRRRLSALGAAFAGSTSDAVNRSSRVDVLIAR
ncbi:nucleotide-binding universal stress UspA family protein [Deinobacterium chartae]|uniref:Nucleotide-binding universal stress UspA family protein n=1 Tax=Deinobacterium chartae TaxID=521158 RepID=A0A841I497_9DEIO|nr:universal stress protein [Deinobacterium chartae]MBB6099864.1 nucleotide-binding universal stress UspA family protein [Deinobacterium chartae]